MPIAVGLSDERFAVRAIMFGAVELARVPVSRHAIALDIAQVRERIFGTLACELHDARFYRDATAAERSISVARRKYATDTGTTSDLSPMKCISPR